jgi:hypothetical protein
VSTAQCLSCRLMTRINRIVVLALAALLMSAIAAPSFAAEGDDETAETTDVTVAVEPISAGDGPMVMIPAPEIDEPEQPWTARFLIPLLVVTAIVLVIGVIIAYNHSVRHRYKVVS